MEFEQQERDDKENAAFLDKLNAVLDKLVRLFKPLPPLPRTSYSRCGICLSVVCCSSISSVLAPICA